MTNTRRPYTEAEQVALTSQVGSYCPLCGQTLFYTKKGRTYKAYELAHIYPLNPRPIEVIELDGVELLHSDVNDPDNIIPLCKDCHGRFDKPRTREEYAQLASVKRKLLDQSRQRAIMGQYPLEADISLIIARLHEVEFTADDVADLELTAKRVDEKFDDSLPHPTRRKIKHAVTDYYQHVKHAFRELELQAPTASELIYAQVRAFYLKQKAMGLPQSAVFNNVVQWLEVTTSPATPEAAEIVASFFVQNCEVFE